MKSKGSFWGFGIMVGIAASTALACGRPSEDVGSDDEAATKSEIESAFDVNDVSILFPTHDTADGKVPFPQIRVSGVAEPGADMAAPDQQLLSGDVFKQVIAEAKKDRLAPDESGGDDFFANRGLWQIAALRFDPCAPGFSKTAQEAAKAAAGSSGPAKCIIQFRLIAQPFTHNSGGSDYAAHLTYNLGTEELSNLGANPVVQNATKLLAAIKAASAKAGANTSGQPLGVHPGLEAEMNAGGKQVSALVTQLVKSLATGPSRAVAFMGLENGGPEPWTFFAGQIVNGKYVILPGPAHGQTAQTLSFLDPGGPVMQKSKNPVNTAPLFASKPSAADKKLAFEVEDTRVSHFFNTDCISCHTSSQRIFNVKGMGDGPEVSSRAPVPANITGYVRKAEAQDNNWNVHNFGYFNGKPTVGGRTVTETVDIVSWINKNVVVPSAGLEGAGRDCSAVDVETFRCFRDGKTNCLSKCAAPPKPTAPETDKPATIVTPTASEDPCVAASVNGAPTVSVSTSEGVRIVKLGGNDAACLSRVLSGKFEGNGSLIVCPSTAACELELDDVAAVNGTQTQKLTGAEATRFRKFFTAKPGTFFKTRASGAGIEVGCSSDTECTIVLADEKQSLPTAGTVLNP